MEEEKKLEAPATAEAKQAPEVSPKEAKENRPHGDRPRGC